MSLTELIRKLTAQEVRQVVDTTELHCRGQIRTTARISLPEYMKKFEKNSIDINANIYQSCSLQLETVLKKEAENILNRLTALENLQNHG